MAALDESVAWVGEEDGVGFEGGMVPSGPCGERASEYRKSTFFGVPGKRLVEP